MEKEAPICGFATIIHGHYRKCANKSQQFGASINWNKCESINIIILIMWYLV